MFDTDSGKKAGYENIRLSFSEKDPYGMAKALLLLPLFIYILYMIWGILSHTFSDASIPNEYRESANILMTMELMKGNNPYSLEALQGVRPPMIYLYGPLYSFVTAISGRAAGFLFPDQDIVMLHYGVTFFCIAVSALLAFMMVRKETGSLLLSLAAFVFLINCSWRYNYVNAVPDSMGLAIMMLILFILSREDFKFREALCAFLTVAVFFTKQYYLLIAGTVTAFIFLSKGIKSAIRYLFFLLGFFAITALLLSLKCPLFWTYTLYLAKGPGKGIASTVTRGSVKMTGAEYNLQQIMSLGGIFFMFFLTETLGVIFFLVRTVKKYMTLKGDGNEGEEKRSRALCIIKKAEEAYTGSGAGAFDLLMFIHLGVSGMCLMYLGRNDGAYLSYYLELFMPALIMGALSLFGKAVPFFRDKRIRGLIALYLVILLAFTSFRSLKRLPLSPLSDKDYGQWKRAEEIMNDNPGDMYLYPLLAFYGIKNDIYIYNTGQPFVVSEKFYKSYHKHPDMMERYPYTETIFTKHFDYREEIRNKVRQGEYSLVSYIEGTDEVFNREDLKTHYRKAESLELRTGRQVWDTEMWVLK